MALKYKPYRLGSGQPGKRYLTMNGLINRGWTQELVETLLKEPCKTVRHPRWRVPTSAWHIDRVIRAESLAQFKISAKPGSHR